MNRTKKKKRGWIWLIVIAAIIAAVFVSCSVLQQQAQLALQMASVKTAEAKTGDITRTVSGTGTLQTVDTLDIQTVSGVRIEKVLVEEGDSVKAGQTLAEIDRSKLYELAADTDIELQQMDMELMRLSGKEAGKTVYAPVEGRIKQIYAKEGDYASDVTAKSNALMVLSTDGNMKVEFKPVAEASVGASVYVKDGGKTYSAKIASVSGDTCTVLLTDDGPRTGKTAAVLAKDKKTELGRGVLAINKPVAINATGGKIDKIYVDLNQKVSRHKRLLRLKDRPLSSDYVKKLAERDQKAGDYAAILALINDPVIRAEKDGVVKKIIVSDGDYAESDSKTDSKATVLTLNDSTLQLNVSLDELDMPFVKAGLPATVSFDALPDKEIAGAVERISSLGTTENGNTKYSVLLSLNELDGLYEGMSATATIRVETRKNVVTLPLEALQEENGRNFVYMDSGKPGILGEVREVKTGLSDGKTVEITQGLKAGDRVMYKIAITDYLSLMNQQQQQQQGGNPFGGMRRAAGPGGNNAAGGTAQPAGPAE